MRSRNSRHVGRPEQECVSCGRRFVNKSPTSPRAYCYVCRPEPGQPPEMSLGERAKIVWALECWGPEASAEFPWSAEELRAHYWGWARKQRPHGEGKWGAMTFGFWRYERGLGIDDAFWRAEDARDARDRRELERELRAEGHSEAEQREALAQLDAEVKRKHREAEEAGEE